MVRMAVHMYFGHYIIAGSAGYLYHMPLLLARVPSVSSSMFNSKTTLERRRQRRRERTATCSRSRGGSKDSMKPPFQR